MPNVNEYLNRTVVQTGRCKSTNDLRKNVTFSRDLDLIESLKSVNYPGSDYSEIYSVGR